MAHDGPVRPDCPISCLDLPTRAVNALWHLDTGHAGAPLVGEVLAGAAGGQVEGLPQVGRVTFGQIVEALEVAGFRIPRDDHRPSRSDS